MKPNVLEDIWKKVNKTSTCWEWTGMIRNKKSHYGAIKINCKTYAVHRIAWELSYGKIPNGMDVLHHCDNPICCNPLHLFLGTDKDNVIDRVSKNRSGRMYGETNHAHKLTREQVKMIKALNWLGYENKELALIYDISATNISYICNEIKWKGV